jgi:hypothetical protein
VHLVRILKTCIAFHLCLFLENVDGRAFLKHWPYSKATFDFSLSFVSFLENVDEVKKGIFEPLGPYSKATFVFFSEWTAPGLMIVIQWFFTQK